MIERIKQIMAFYGMSVNSFALKIGANQVTLNQQMNGDRKISLDTVLKICSTFKLVSSDWVLIGEGSMLKSDASHTDHAKESVVIDMAQDSSSIYERMIEKKDKRIEELALMVGNLQKEVEMLNQDKKTAQEESDALNAVERLRLTGTDDR